MFCEAASVAIVYVTERIVGNPSVKCLRSRRHHVYLCGLASRVKDVKL